MLSDLQCWHTSWYYTHSGKVDLCMIRTLPYPFKLIPPNPAFTSVFLSSVFVHSVFLVGEESWNSVRYCHPSLSPSSSSLAQVSFTENCLTEWWTFHHWFALSNLRMTHWTTMRSMTCLMFSVIKHLGYFMFKSWIKEFGF